MSKSNYSGLPDDLKALVWARDDYRCRWCGRTNAGVDIHHIEYRRGYQQDHLDNLVTLCREHHGFIHDSYEILKADAQKILFFLVTPEGGGKTGLSLWNRVEPGTMRPARPARPARPMRPTGKRVGRMVGNDGAGR